MSTKIIDPWAGSYAMEALTNEVYQAGKSVIEEVEAMGGMAKAVESGKYCPYKEVEAMGNDKGLVFWWGLGVGVAAWGTERLVCGALASVVWGALVSGVRVGLGFRVWGSFTSGLRALGSAAGGTFSLRRWGVAGDFGTTSGAGLALEGFGKEVIVGVNKYRLEKEETVDVLMIDNNEVRETQINKLKQVRGSRDPQAVQAALAKLEAAALGSENLLAAAVVAARARATLGEISAAMEKVLYCIRWYMGHTFSHKFC
ncbi:putative methylmalonyl-CoA mutase, mitochondrial [Portunus trituberculatus]|uniref:Putative methylmalonyl-CoA mutase, mitochondrial n=1 Tax=Portunus trituberculatus TaxID=210409 RepID=A0A5B7FCY4_PORTR|nr:putative methylmalonyl-CoA mutase, mitochondrial [Portunus trituberculatus]